MIYHAWLSRCTMSGHYDATCTVIEMYNILHAHCDVRAQPTRCITSFRARSGLVCKSSMFWTNWKLCGTRRYTAVIIYTYVCLITSSWCKLTFENERLYNIFPDLKCFIAPWLSSEICSFPGTAFKHKIITFSSLNNHNLKTLSLSMRKQACTIIVTPKWNHTINECELYCVRGGICCTLNFDLEKMPQLLEHEASYRVCQLTAIWKENKLLLISFM